MKMIQGLLCAGILLAGSRALRAEDGLYFTSPTNTGRSATNDKGETLWVGKKADVEILKANVYSQDNANSSFTVSLTTTDYKMDPRELALCAGHLAYVPNGWGSSGGHTNSMDFVVYGESEAKAVAKSLSVDCGLRAPPGYKYLAQFVPAKTEFQTNEAVPVKFELKNLDDRIFAFQRGGQQRGARDNQYGFRAMLIGSPGAKSPVQPVTDVGNPVNFGGKWGLVMIEPGKTFESEIDLKKWFAFDQPGTYPIHGFYALALYRPEKDNEAMMSWNVLWGDYASADFQVTISKNIEVVREKQPEAHAKATEEAPDKKPYDFQSYREPDSGIIFYIEGDLHHIVALDKDGKILWRRQPALDGNLPPYSEEHPMKNPAIVWLGGLTEKEKERLKKTGSGKFIGISFGSRQAGVLDVKNGDFIFEGQD